MRTILVPLDDSTFGEGALPTARVIAQRAPSALHLALVHVPIYSSYVDGAPILDPELDAASRANEQDYLQAIRQRLAGDGTAPSSAAVLDGPVAEISRRA
jgi:nucleotide-binding universal stress UspA family protein